MAIIIRQVSGRVIGLELITDEPHTKSDRLLPPGGFAFEVIGIFTLLLLGIHSIIIPLMSGSTSPAQGFGGDLPVRIGRAIFLDIASFYVGYFSF